MSWLVAWLVVLSLCDAWRVLVGVKVKWVCVVHRKTHHKTEPQKREEEREGDSAKKKHAFLNFMATLKSIFFFNPHT